MGNESSQPSRARNEGSYYRGQPYSPPKYQNNTYVQAQPMNRVRRPSISNDKGYNFWNTIMPAPAPTGDIQPRPQVTQSAQMSGYDFWNTVNPKNQAQVNVRRPSFSGSSFRYSPPQNQVQYARPLTENVPRPVEYYQPRQASAEYVISPNTPAHKQVEYVQRPPNYGRRVSVESAYAIPRESPYIIPYVEGNYNSKQQQYGNSSNYDRIVTSPGSYQVQPHYIGGYETTHGSNGVLMI